MRRRMFLAVGLSLALHALLFALLLRLPKGTPTRAPPRPLVVEVLERPPHGRPQGASSAPASPGRGGGPSHAHASAPATPPLPGTGLPDAPRAALNLYPEGALAAASPAARVPDVPDAGSPAEVLVARVQGWRLAALAEHRVAMGVDSYFSTLAHALRDGMGSAPPPGGGQGPSGGQRLLQSWLSALAEAEAPPPEAPREERGPTQPQHDLGGREADMVHQLLGPMAPTQESLVAPFELLKKAQAELPPSAVLRLAQDADGHLVQVELVASSGDARFDAWVKRSAALALASAPKPPGYGAGLHPDGTRSEWAFYRTGDAVAVRLLRVY